MYGMSQFRSAIFLVLKTHVKLVSTKLDSTALNHQNRHTYLKSMYTALEIEVLL